MSALYQPLWRWPESALHSLQGVKVVWLWPIR